MEELSYQGIVAGESFFFVYLERIGAFEIQAPKAWGDLFGILNSSNLDKSCMSSMLALSKIDSSKEGDEKFSYQAGFSTLTKIEELPESLLSRTVDSRKYAKFLLKGPYCNLGRAYQVAIEMISENKIEMENDFAMEVYLNTPNQVSEDELLTEIFLPVK